MNILYEMLVDNPSTDGVFAVSLVDRPAIEENFILLHKDDKVKIDLKLNELKTGERRTITGPALIPDKIIPRNGYDIIFSKDTIRKISENFIINGKNSNFTLQHAVSVNGIYLIESWIVEDPNNDKSKNLGFNVPEGTWMISLKVMDENIWTEYIASGILLGISIEGNFGKKEVHLHSEKCNHNHIDEDLHNLYLAMNFTPADLDKYYVWKLGSVEGKENCPICIKNNGKVHTLRQWLSLGIPRVRTNTKIAGELTSYQYGDYGTYCTTFCNCELVPVATEVKRRVISPFGKK